MYEASEKTERYNHEYLKTYASYDSILSTVECASMRRIPRYYLYKIIPRNDGDAGRNINFQKLRLFTKERKKPRSPIRWKFPNLNLYRKYNKIREKGPQGIVRYIEGFILNGSFVWEYLRTLSLSTIYLSTSTIMINLGT